MIKWWVCLRSHNLSFQFCWTANFFLFFRIIFLNLCLSSLWFECWRCGCRFAISTILTSICYSIISPPLIQEIIITLGLFPFLCCLFMQPFAVQYTIMLCGNKRLSRNFRTFAYFQLLRRRKRKAEIFSNGTNLSHFEKLEYVGLNKSC